MLDNTEESIVIYENHSENYWFKKTILKVKRYIFSKFIKKILINSFTKILKTYKISIISSKY